MSLQSVIRPKAPNNSAWRFEGAGQCYGYANAKYYHPALRLYVISGVEAPEGEPEYHVSISKAKPGKEGPSRCSAEEARLAIKQFGMDGAKEDNHSPVVRSYWMPVAESQIGAECPCKEHETPVIEGDFEWRPLTKENADRAKSGGAA